MRPAILAALLFAGCDSPPPPVVPLAVPIAPVAPPAPPEPAEPPVAEPVPAETPTLDSAGRQTVMRAIRSKMRPIQRCYEQELARKPDLAGTVHLHVVMPESGPPEVSITNGTMNPPPSFGECVVAAMHGIDLGDVARPVTFDYPLTFSAGE